MGHNASAIKDMLEHGVQRQVAKQLKLSESYVSTVINGTASGVTDRGRKTQRRVRVAIARKLGRPVDEVFPQAKQEAAPKLARAS